MELNKIFNCDCLELMKTLPDKCIDLVCCDPPYGMGFNSGYRTIKHDKIINDDNLEWLPEYLQQCKRILKEDAHSYFFCSTHFVDIFVSEIKKYLPYKNILIWEKNNTGMGDLFGDYAPKYEFIIFCSNGEKKLNGGRDANIIKGKRTTNELHPTQKPVSLISYLIEKSTKEGDIVFDGFLGSGTTAVSAQELYRKYIGCELDKDYFEIAEKRLGFIKQRLF